jgi:hypothetical protein
VFENRVLRRMFGPKCGDVIGKWRKLHNGELHNLYSTQNIIRQKRSRIMRWTAHVVCMGEDGKVYKVLAENLEGKIPLGIPRRLWEDGIKMDLEETGWGVRSGFTWLRTETG